MVFLIVSFDFLVVVVVNGLMIKEMGEIWGILLQLDVLREVVVQLVWVVFVQGVVEWIGQILFGLVKLDGGSWLIVGLMQVLSVVYFICVVGCLMVDWLVINVGVDEFDFVVLKQQVLLLVVWVVEEEWVNWNGFVQ